MSCFSLYNLSLETFVHVIPNEAKTKSNGSPSFAGYFNSVLAPNIYLDTLIKLCEMNKFSIILDEIADSWVFCKIIHYSVGRKHFLHQWFQKIMDYCIKQEKDTITALLSKSFLEKCENINEKNRNALVHDGITLANFLADAGWFLEAGTIYKKCLSLLMSFKKPQYLYQALGCATRLLSANNGYCQFDEANKTYNLAWAIINDLLDQNLTPKLALLFAEISNLQILQSNYESAYKWSQKALEELDSSYPDPIIVKVFRQAATACVLKRKYKKAELLIKQALLIAQRLYDPDHPKYADALSDFAFYLLNIDAINQGIKVCRESFRIRGKIFGGNNLYLAIAREDLSYASYVHNYSRGTFQEARMHAEESLKMMLQILPHNHLLLSSCKRVKALILEEMAIDCIDKLFKEQYLNEAHTLHKEALSLAKEAFGELNVQTAKHYGDLGRLYQTMCLEREAEEMHKRAIQIKEMLLGPNDYEVALSLGHLASLYNYDMQQFEEAEELYYRSIEIGISLFGESYSGLQYDYRGLLRIFESQNKLEQKSLYRDKFDNWKILREELKEETNSPLDLPRIELPIEDVLQRFSEL